MVKTDIHFSPDKVIFSLFTTEEIKNMCVMQIITPLMLDPLGHPIPGGLYDKKLGKHNILFSNLGLLKYLFSGPISDKSDICETCYKTMTNCPGHFGYIELPLPLVNPLFHKLIGTILKISCLSCHQIQLPSK